MRVISAETAQRNENAVKSLRGLAAASLRDGHVDPVCLTGEQARALVSVIDGDFVDKGSPGKRVTGIIEENKRLREKAADAVVRLKRAAGEAGDLLQELAALKLALQLAESRNDSLCARVIELEDAAIAALGGPN